MWLFSNAVWLFQRFYYLQSLRCLVWFVFLDNFPRLLSRISPTNWCFPTPWWFLRCCFGSVHSAGARVSMVLETVKKSCLIVSACNIIQTHRHGFFFFSLNLPESFSALRFLSRSISNPQASIFLPHFIELNRVVCCRQTITLFLYLTETVGAQIGCARIVSLTITEESIFILSDDKTPLFGLSLELRYSFFHSWLNKEVNEHLWKVSIKGLVGVPPTSINWFPLSWLSLCQSPAAHIVVVLSAYS